MTNVADDELKQEVWPLFPSKSCTHVSKVFIKRTFELDFKQRLFMIFESPLSCKLASIWSFFVLFVILLSCGVFIGSTVPALMHVPDSCIDPKYNHKKEAVCPPIPPIWFDRIELGCIIVFTFDYLARILLVSYMPPRLLGLIKEETRTFEKQQKYIDKNADILDYMHKLLEELDNNDNRIKELIKHQKENLKKSQSITVKMSESYVDLHKLKNSKNMNRSQSGNDLGSGSLLRKNSEDLITQDPLLQIITDFSSGDGDNDIGMSFETTPETGLRISSVPSSSNELNSANSPKKKPENSQVINNNFDSPTSKKSFVTPSGIIEVEEVDYHKFYKFSHYFLSVYNIIDLLAVVPFYIELSGSGINLSFIRVLRLARVMRVFKLGKNMSGFIAVTKTIKKSFQALGVVGFFILLSVLLFGCIEYFIESGRYMVTEDFPNGAYLRKGVDGIYEVSTFTSIPASLYWAVVTAVTVGYGDMTPASALGKVVAVCCMYLGVLMMALPITVIGNNFNREYENLVGNDVQHTIFDSLQKLLYKYDEEIRQMACRSKSVVKDPKNYSEKTALLLSISNCLDEVKRQKLQASLENMMELKKLQYLEDNNAKFNAYTLERELTDLFETTEYINQSRPFSKQNDPPSSTMHMLSQHLHKSGDMNSKNKFSQASKQNQSEQHASLSKSPGKWDYPE